MNNKEDASSLAAPRDQNRKASPLIDDSQQIQKLYARFGERVKQIRHQKRLTQAEMASSIRIDRAYLSEIETGRRRVSLHIAHQIAHALDLSLDTLVGNI